MSSAPKQTKGQSKAPSTVSSGARTRAATASAQRQSRAAALRLVPSTRSRRAAAGQHAASTAPGDTAASSSKGGIQSVERALAILAEISQHEHGIRLVELSAAVGLRNSTTFHLIKTMMSLGYVEKVRDSKRYRIGRRLFTLAAGALDEIGLVNLATPVLEDLSRSTSECSHFAVRAGSASRIVARTSGTGMFQVIDHIGTQRPVHCTALGKVLLAALAPPQLERYLQSLELRPFTPRTIVDAALLREEIERVRQEGIGYDDGEFDAELRCMAVPVYDFSRRVVGALGISGPVWRLSIQALQAKAPQVRAAGVALSALLGFDGQNTAREQR